MNKVFSIFTIVLLTGIFSIQSCKKDVEGCSDPTADNYDPEATVSGECKFTGCTDAEAENYDPKANVSGNCTYAREKFIGAYSGSLACPGQLIFISGMTDFTIDENIAGGKNDVTILITTNTGLLFPVSGTCVGNKVTINTSLENVDITFQGNTIKVNIVATGEATYNETTKTLSGPLTITASNVLISFTDNCTITGIKK